MKIPTLLASLAFVGSRAGAKPCGNDLAVKVDGGVIHGMVDGATPAVRQFRGIPFAQPPVDHLRFAPPAPLEHGPGDLDATKMPPSCMQYLGSAASLYTQDVLEFNLGGLNKTGVISEDCLYLNVWSPRGQPKNLPVLVYIYGGGFSTGGIDVPYQLPEEWIQRTESHVVVSFNYRVNLFGYPNAAGLDLPNQNPGLLDQRLAVEWVRDNIAAFGGDPARMTLWGQSAGAVSVGYYSFAYADDPIVSALIMNSGSELLSIGVEDPSHSNFTFVASQLGCGGEQDSLSPTQELACMRSLDAREIETFLQEYGDAGTSPALSFAPVVDGRTVFDNFTALALDGKVASVPTIFGYNREDGSVFMPYDPAGWNETLMEQAGLASFYCPSLQAAKNRLNGASAAGALSVYRYVYAGNFTNVSPRGWMGAYHSSELPMIFGTHPLYRGDSTGFEYETSHAMQDHYLAFASGSIESEEPVWMPMTMADSGNAMEYGAGGVAARMIDTADLDKMCG